MTKAQKRKFLVRLSIWSLFLPILALGMIFGILIIGFPEIADSLLSIRLLDSVDGGFLALWVSPLGLTLTVVGIGVLIVMGIMLKIGLTKPMCAAAKAQHQKAKFSCEKSKVIKSRKSRKKNCVKQRIKKLQENMQAIHTSDDYSRGYGNILTALSIPGEQIGEVSKPGGFVFDEIPQTVPSIKPYKGYTPVSPQKQISRTPPIHVVTNYQVTDIGLVE